MKLLQKAFEVSKEIEKFTVCEDREMDLMLAEHDVIGSIAHAKMLTTINLLTTNETNPFNHRIIRNFTRNKAREFYNRRWY